MKKLAWIVGMVIGAVLLFVAIVVATNALDEPLSPAAQAMAKEMELEVKPSEGFDYLLGLTAPSDQDPLVAGRTIREESRAMRDANLGAYRTPGSTRNVHVASESKKCEGIESRPIYCGKDWYQAHVEEIQDLGQDNAFLLSRYDKLISFASLNTDPPARILIDSNIAEIQKLLRIKQDIWGLNWMLGNRDNVIRGWTESNRFLNRWLEATPISMIEAMMVLHLLETQKTFALEIMKSDETAASHFNSENLLTLKPTVSFDRVMNKVAVSEFYFFHAIAGTSPNIGSFLDMNFGGGTRESSSILYKLPVPLLKWNATLNEYTQRLHEAQNEPCVTDASACVGVAKALKFTLINPIGRNIVAVLNPSSPVYEKMYERYSNVSGL